MRISDWSSDVCSSDLPNNLAAHLVLVLPPALYLVWDWAKRVDPPRPSQIILTSLCAIAGIPLLLLPGSRAALVALIRPEERRVGKEGVSTCRSTWWRALEKKKDNKSKQKRTSG